MTVSAGGSYRSNVRQNPDDFDRPSDVAFEGTVDVLDERTLGSVRLRSLAEADLRLHVDEGDLNQVRGHAWTGPVVRPQEDIEVHVAAGGGASWFDDGLLYVEGSGRAEVTFLGGRSPQTLTLRAGYRDVRDERDGSRGDGYFVRLDGRFARIGTLVPGDALFLQPFARYSSGDMSYLEERWRLSDLNCFPSSRQMMWSGVIDFLTGTAGLGRSAGADGALAPPFVLPSARWTSAIRFESSDIGTGLLLT